MVLGSLKRQNNFSFKLAGVINIVCVCVCARSLCAVDLGMGNGTEERHDFSIVQEESDQRDGGFLFLSAHLAQDVRGRRGDGL